MSIKCLKCKSEESASDFRRVIRAGRFRRKSDCRFIQVYQCQVCLKKFIAPNPRHGQNKRQFNDRVVKLLCSGVSQRRTALLLGINRKTVVRKLRSEAIEADKQNRALAKAHPKTKVVVFDDLETFEHTKCKPLSVTLAVNEHRRILAFEISQMAAKGKLAKPALKKYGPRKDTRHAARKRFFHKLTEMVEPDALFRSDQNPFYSKTLKAYFPKAIHETHRSMRSSIGGQGELKKVGHDPLFALNHTCAMLRANINRLFRKTWCTTKSPENLRHHLVLYMRFHNVTLLNGS